MNYYSKDQYKTRYIVKFKDMLDELWTVNIEDPTFDGTPTELTGAENPLEWSGSGDEDQTKCLLGSTGYIRIVCLPGQESIFEPGGVLPTEVNNRRVTVWRNSRIMWTGFVKCENYEQEIDNAPYDIELPIISSIASLEYLTLPPFEDVEEPTTTCKLLQYIVKLTGLNINEIVTNVAEYEDYFGNKVKVSDTNPRNRHWTESQVLATYWYDVSDTDYTPRTLADVLDTILSPYGHIREYGNNWGIFFEAKNESQRNSIIYKMSTDPGVQSDSILHDDGLRVPTMQMDDIARLSTDNRMSFFAPPSSVSYARDIDSNASILEFKDSWIKNTFRPSYGSMRTIDYDAMKRCISLIDDEDVNLHIFDKFEHTYNAKLCRVIDVKEDNNTPSGYTYSETIPLAIYVQKNASENLKFCLKSGVNSRTGYNKILLSIEEYNLSDRKHEPTTTPKSKLFVNDINKSLYLDEDGNWLNFVRIINVANLRHNGSQFFISFNERHNNEEYTSHRDITFSFFGDINDDLIIVPKITYIKDDVFTEFHTEREMSPQNYSAQHYTYSTGDAIDATFKTMCGQIYTAIDGAANIPFNGFLDNVGLIDTGSRKSLNINDARCVDVEPLCFIFQYTIVTEGNTSYIPASVGCNARNATMKLTLIQTNRE